MSTTTEYVSIFGVYLENAVEIDHFIKPKMDFCAVQKELEENNGVAYFDDYCGSSEYSYYLGFDLSYFCLEENASLKRTEIQQKIIEKINSLDFIKNKIPEDMFKYADTVIYDM